MNAARANAYHALLDAGSVGKWMVMSGMTSRVHALDARDRGSFRISLTDGEPTGTRNTAANTDTFHGRLVTLVTNEQLIQVVEFETTDPTLRAR